MPAIVTEQTLNVTVVKLSLDPLSFDGRDASGDKDKVKVKSTYTFRMNGDTLVRTHHAVGPLDIKMSSVIGKASPNMPFRVGEVVQVRWVKMKNSNASLATLIQRLPR